MVGLVLFVVGFILAVAAPDLPPDSVPWQLSVGYGLAAAGMVTMMLGGLVLGK